MPSWHQLVSWKPYESAVQHVLTPCQRGGLARWLGLRIGSSIPAAAGSGVVRRYFSVFRAIEYQKCWNWELLKSGLGLVFIFLRAHAIEWGLLSKNRMVLLKRIIRLREDYTNVCPVQWIYFPLLLQPTIWERITSLQSGVVSYLAGRKKGCLGSDAPRTALFLGAVFSRERKFLIFI